VMISKNEVQNAADASALAGCRLLGSFYEELGYEDQQTFVPDPAPIIDRAKTAAHYNEVARKNIDLADNEVEIGVWDAHSKTFTPTLTHPDAVRVTAHRDDSVNGKIPTFFAKIMGIDSMGVAARATAALTGSSTVAEGGLPLPVGISKFRFDSPFCNQPIKFYPTGTLEGCAGWDVYSDGNPNDSKLRGIIEGLTEMAEDTPAHEAGYQSPETIAYETAFNFIGGTMSENTFLDFMDLFNAAKILNDGIIDADEDPTTWTTTVPVYDWLDCSNPNTTIQIVGFATVTITTVETAPEKTIMGTILCLKVEGGRGGGGDFGTMGSIPNLVQ